MTGAEGIKVAVRVRPFNKREEARGAKNLVTMAENGIVTLGAYDDEEERKFTFDFAYDSFTGAATQDDVFNDLGTYYLDQCQAGFNVSLFAYGQTGAGKSFSMTGTPSLPGIIPRGAERLFEIIEANNDDSVSYEVETAFLEIYNEEIRDLLDPKTDKDLTVRQNPKLGVYVQNLSRHLVTSYDEISKLMMEGTAARTIASTKMNATSSRSHSVMTIYFKKTTAAGKEKMTKTAKINLIDLAGSERQANTGAKGQRLREACAINQSLSALGNVISALADNATRPRNKRRHVPFRDSTLTRLLQESLGGNSKTIMIAAVSPADINAAETLSTLRYADRVKQIKTKAKVNESPQDALVRGLKEELERLKAELAASKKGAVVEIKEEEVSESDVEEEEAVEEEEEEVEVEVPEEVAAHIKPVEEDEDDKEERAAARAAAEAELAAQMEALAAQLAAEQQTSAQKAAEAAAFRKQREEMLQDNGVDIKELMAMHAPGQPCLVNISPDAMMSGCLMYYLKEGRVVIGTEPGAGGVRVLGQNISQEHAILEIRMPPAQEEEQEVPTPTLTLSLSPSRAEDDPKLFVNGQPVTSAPVQLSLGDRLIVGSVVLRAIWGDPAAVPPLDHEDALQELALARGMVSVAEEFFSDIKKADRLADEANEMAQAMGRRTMFAVDVLEEGAGAGAEVVVSDLSSGTVARWSIVEMEEAMDGMRGAVAKQMDVRQAMAKAAALAKGAIGAAGMALGSPPASPKLELPIADDPFRVLPEDVLIGHADFPLAGLLGTPLPKLFKVKLDVLDDKGDVVIDEEKDDVNLEVRFAYKVDTDRLDITLLKAKDVPSGSNAGVFVKLTGLQATDIVTARCDDATKEPRWKETLSIPVPRSERVDMARMTARFEMYGHADYLLSDPMELRDQLKSRGDEIRKLQEENERLKEELAKKSRACVAM